MQDELRFALFNESMNPVSLLTYGVTSKKKAGLPGLPIPQAAGAVPPCPPCSNEAESLTLECQGKTRFCGGDPSPEAL